MIYLFTLGSGHSSENTYGEINISVEVTNVISILSYFGDLLWQLVSIGGEHFFLLIKDVIWNHFITEDSKINLDTQNH